MSKPIHREIEKRFGVLPNFFRFTCEDPEVTANLWGFARFAYLDSPMPSLFKERLFVYLSRFCAVKYCLARHVGFLIGLGYPSGDPSCLPQKIEAVLPLLCRPLAREEQLEAAFALLGASANMRAALPQAESAEEIALFAALAHVFLQTPQAARAQAVLRGAAGAERMERLGLFLAFVRAAHFWTELHPELPLEADIRDLLSTHLILAQCVMNNSGAREAGLSRQVMEDLAALRGTVGVAATSGRTPAAGPGRIV